MRVTVPSIDRMLAKIDRALEPPLRLPVGGPVGDRLVYCWADHTITHWHLRGVVVSCPVDVREHWEETGGLCRQHFAEIADV